MVPADQYDVHPILGQLHDWWGFLPTSMMFIPFLASSMMNARPMPPVQPVTASAQSPRKEIRKEFNLTLWCMPHKGRVKMIFLSWKNSSVKDGVRKFYWNGCFNFFHMWMITPGTKVPWCYRGQETWTDAVVNSPPKTVHRYVKIVHRNLRLCLRQPFLHAISEFKRGGGMRG